MRGFCWLVKQIKSLEVFAGSFKRQEDIFSSGGIFSRTGSRFKGLKGIENIYTQHSPRLEVLLDHMSKGRLREQSYPFLDHNGSNREKPQDVIVFIVGGVTFQEAKVVAQVNASAQGFRVALGGSCVLNSKAFLQVFCRIIGYFRTRSSLQYAHDTKNLWSGVAI